DAGDPVPTDQLSVETTPCVQVCQRLVVLLNPESCQGLAGIAPMMRAGRAIRRHIKVDDVVVLVMSQAVVERSCQGGRVVRAEGVHYQDQAHESIAETSQVLAERGPVRAAEDRIWTDRVDGLTSGDPPLQQPSTRTGQGQGLPAVRLGGHVLRAQVTTPQHGPGRYHPSRKPAIRRARPSL